MVSKIQDHGLQDASFYNYANPRHIFRRGYTGSVVASILNFDTNLFAVNESNIHWFLTRINIREHKIQIYGSLYSQNKPVYLEIQSKVMAWLIDQHERFQPLNVFFDALITPLNIEIVDVPRQVQNNCGVFTCMFARYIAFGHALNMDFAERDMNNIRIMMLNEIYHATITLQT